MRIWNRLSITTLLALLVAGGLYVSTPSIAQDAKKAPDAAKTEAVESKTPVDPSAYKVVAPLDLVKTPETYLDQYVAFEGTFNRFSDMGLDYQKAFRDSRDYVSMLILRPDVKHHDIPLSELKLFFPRKKSEDVSDMDTGDVVSIRGQVFSNALGEPWVDIQEIKVVLKKEKDKKKSPAEECC